MVLSMQVLRDRLEQYAPEADCKNDKPGLIGLRLYAPGMDTSDEMLYLGVSDQFFHDGGKRIVLYNQDNYLYLSTEDMVAIANEIQETFRFYQDWYDLCSKMLANGCGLSELLNRMEKILPFPILVADTTQTLVGVSDLAWEYPNDEWQTSMRRRGVSEERLRRFNRMQNDTFSRQGIFVVDSDCFFMKSFCKQLFIDGERKATVILKVPERDCTPGELHLLEICTGLVEQWVRRNSTSDGGGPIQMVSHLARILDGAVDHQAALERHLSLFEWEVDCRKNLIVISALSKDFRFADMIRIMNNESLGSYGVNYRGSMLLLCNADKQEQNVFYESLGAILKQNNCYAAVSLPFTDLELLPQAYQQAAIALEQGTKCAGRIHQCGSTALLSLMEYISQRVPGLFLHPALTILKTHDRQNKTDYYRTVLCYLQNERRQQATADALFIHRNTLFLRLQKILELCPINFDDPTERLYLLFSFYQDYLSGYRDALFSDTK